MKPPKITVKIQGDRELLRKLEAANMKVSSVLEAAAQAGAAIIRAKAAQAAPGPEVVAETTSKTKTRATVSVGPDSQHWYYAFFETGTPPHKISARKKSLLVFDGERGTVRTMSVMHPGMGAKPFLRPAFDTSQDNAPAEVGDAWRQAIDGAVK